MRIKHIVDVSDIPLSREEWNKLVLHNETNTIFQTFEWFLSWYKTFAINNDLCLLVVYENEAPIGFAPLVFSKNNNNKTIQLAGYSNADYLDFVTPTKKQDVINLIIEYLTYNINDWDQIILNNIPCESSTSMLIYEACKRLNLKYLKKNPINCPYLHIQGRHDEVNKLLNKYSNKRPFNYFRKQGDLKYQVLTKAETQKHLTTFISQHIRRWATTSSPSLFYNPLNKRFYDYLTEQLSDTGWLHFSVLELNETPISYHYGFDYDDKYYWYKPSFNVDYSTHSPGTLLIRYLIQTAMENERREFDFTIGNEPFKRRFANKVRHNTNLHIHRSKRLYWIQNALFHAGKLKRHIID
ncbi:MAG: GNAT family N-acetyltransferase [Candidatus Thiodiazotropha sp.]